MAHCEDRPSNSEQNSRGRTMDRDLHRRDRVGVQDFVLLEDYQSESAFIENLRKRFKEDIIYTYIGTVLISVNPYKNLRIYTAEAVKQYKGLHFYEASPHIYAISDTALRFLLEENREQCILISGESGSGKTEASKKVLEFVAETTGHTREVDRVKDKLLQSNPVLEAFGNAKTNRNDNSSRFGKYMDIEFLEGSPVGGKILNYLLEKSRVVHQYPGERNFHIFYQLLAGADDEMLSKLMLKRDLDSYFYFSQGQKGAVDEIDDRAQFQTVKSALSTIELTDKEQDDIFAIVASVLHMGNVGMTEVEGRAVVSKLESVEAIAQLLGCEAEKLTNAFTNRTIEARGDVVTTPLNRETALYARDALAKAVYDRLFTWLVTRLNVSLKPDSEKTTKAMGILDIYGFEIFETNSFEQFCINFCNEKLQQLFIELTLKSEQEEYLKEGIEWEPVEYFNNKVICDLIEEKHKGIIALMDEECLRPGEPTDMSFLNKMNENLSDHPHYISHKKADIKTQKIMGRDEFQLVHYAGTVAYNIRGFLDKNNDLLFRDLREVMSVTTNSITKAVFPVSDVTSKKRPETAGTQFKNSVNRLMEILGDKEPSYIRCIKPNDDKRSGIFNEKVVLHQVKYLGLMENLRVRRAGFAFRRVYELFLQRYKSLCPETWPFYKGSAKDGVQTLVNYLGYGKDDYRMGRTKLFIRFPKTLFETEDAFQERKNYVATIIQKVWKGILQRRKYIEMRNSAIIIQKYIRRHLAQNEAQRRRKGVEAIRRFIKGFITRHGPVNEVNKGFIQVAKVHYLNRLAKSLPKSVLDKSWPPCPQSCTEASRYLHQLHERWLARKYRLSLTPEAKKQFELKILAESLFKDKKKSYPNSIASKFVEERLKPEHKTLVPSFVSSHLQNGDKVLYSISVTKYDRHGYKPRERAMLVTSKSLYVLDGKTFKLKHNLPLNSIQEIVVTTASDNLMLLRIPPDLKKDKGDLILEAEPVIEAVTKIVDITKKPQLIKILEADTISHNLIGGKQGVIDITTGPTPAISKGKSGHLVVVASP
ncbi:unconventional myosin IC isoform X1 [Schistocerca americana]|uniref:unconventional myosin IC isoform X1 n=2 Tax=Schistocerca americana TaxID=7009 RepID=UPI001F4F22F8|nr:unconventional myosin IC isoform X1 [Schistocerca americana]